MPNVNVDREVKGVLITSKSQQQIKTKKRVSENDVIRQALKKAGMWKK